MTDRYPKEIEVWKNVLSRASVGLMVGLEPMELEPAWRDSDEEGR
jgi:hypothetical protein